MRYVYSCRISFFERFIMEQRFKLWDDSDIEIVYYKSLHKSSDGTVVILPGGGYARCCAHEGENYAQLFNTFGMDAFVIDYRTSPNRFPLPLLDARRAVRFVRSHAGEFGLSKDKILVMGSSAGGHLCALLSTYFDAIDGEGIDEIDKEDFIPNGQILCYPVISSDESISHKGSYMNLFGEDGYDKRASYSPDLLVSNRTPKAFLWHTCTDSGVKVSNSYRYAEALYKNGVSHELHVFPVGEHGQALGAWVPYIAEWTNLLRRWLTLNGFLNNF